MRTGAIHRKKNMNITKTMLVMTGFLALSLLVGCGEGEPPQTTADEPGKVAKSAAIELTDEQVKNIVRRSYQYVALYNVINKSAMDPGNPAITGWNERRGVA